MHGARSRQQVLETGDYFFLDPSRGSSSLQISKQSANILTIQGVKYTWKFDCTKGTIISWIKNTSPGVEIANHVSKLGFYRALTDNDAPRAGLHWKEKRLHQTKPHLQSIFTHVNEHGEPVVTGKFRIAPPVPSGERVEAKASFGLQEGCSFSASHYAVEDVDAARHPFELERKRRDDVIVVRLDWRHMGLGTGSCGPDCLPEYELRSQDFEFDLWLE